MGRFGGITVPHEVKKSVSKKILKSENPSLLTSSDIEDFIKRSTPRFTDKQVNELPSLLEQVINRGGFDALYQYSTKNKFKESKKRLLADEIANLVFKEVFEALSDN